MLDGAASRKVHGAVQVAQHGRLAHIIAHVILPGGSRGGGGRGGPRRRRRRVGAHRPSQHEVDETLLPVV